MKIRHITRIAALSAAAVLLCAASAVGASYTTQQYHVDMEVSENQVLKVKETMNVDFLSPSHGIYRTIPYRGQMTYEYEGEAVTEPYLCSIEDVDVEGFEYQTDYDVENGSLLIRIGSEDKLVEGEMTYPMEYTAVIYEDKNKNLDQLYWNLIPTGTQAITESASFEIRMPKEFDPGSVAFSAGYYGMADDISVDFRVEGNVIYAQTNRALLAGEGVTLRIELPEGYFSGAASRSWMMGAIWASVILAPLAAAALWFFFGRDKKIVPTVEFYPPAGLSSAEVGYILDGASDNKDVISMVLYFADKGVLEIHEEEKNKFRLIKKKDLPPRAKSYERTMFYGLFASGDSVLLGDLEGDFYETFTTAKELLAGEFTAKKGQNVYTKKSRMCRVLAVLFALLPLLLESVLGASYAYGNILDIIVSFPMVLVIFLAYFGLIAVFDKRDQMKKSSKMLGTICLSVVLALGMLCYVGYQSFVGMPETAVCTAVSSLICLPFSMLMLKRTDYSVDMMGKILGFKEFIRTAELDRLKLLVEETPEYFYHILPYAWVFGLTDKWIKNFEGIAVPEPQWYYTGYEGNVFTTYYFMRSFNRCTNSLARSIAAPPAETGGAGGGFGGGFSGGGFSGGGMGGGSMGSW